MLVLPGLINAHHHGMAVSTVQLGFPRSGPPEPGLRDTPFESWMATMLALDAVDPYLGTLAKNVLLLESGVTSHLHMHFPSGRWDGAPEEAYARELDDTLRAHRESGQRVALAPHWRDRSRLAYDGDEPFLAALPPDLQRARAGSRELVHLQRCVHRDDPRPRGRARRRPAAERAVRDHGAAVGERRARRGGRLGCRGARRRDPSPLAGEPPAASLGRCLRRWARARAARRRGVLGDRSALAHGVWLRDSDIELVARSGATVVHNASSNLRLAAGVAPLRRLVAAGAGVALGLDDMGIADDDDMLAEVRMAHALQRVHGEPQYPRLRAAEVFGLMWDGGAKVIGAPVGRLEPGRRGDLVVADLRALRAPYAVDDIDVWELLVSRGKAAHVDSVVVGGRVLMRGRTLQHLDRDAIMAEVADAAASAIARRNPDDRAWMTQLGRRIAEHYQAQVWHAGA